MFLSSILVPSKSPATLLPWIPGVYTFIAAKQVITGAVTQYNAHLFTHSPVGWTADMAWRGFRFKTEIKVSARLNSCLEVLGKIHFRAHSCCQQNSGFARLSSRDHPPLLQATLIPCHVTASIPRQQEWVGPSAPNLWLAFLQPGKALCIERAHVSQTHLDHLPILSQVVWDLNYICKSLYYNS